MDGLTENRIAEQLQISQSSVSRDLLRLDGDAEKLARNLARLELADNSIWVLFSQLDRAAAAILKEFDDNKHSDPKSRLTELHLLLDLLYRKCYLLKFAAVEASSVSLAVNTNKTLTEQYWQLGVRFQILEEKLNGKVEQQA